MKVLLIAVLRFFGPRGEMTLLRIIEGKNSFKSGSHGMQKFFFRMS